MKISKANRHQALNKTKDKLPLAFQEQSRFWRRTLAYDLSPSHRTLLAGFGLLHRNDDARYGDQCCERPWWVRRVSKKVACARISQVTKNDDPRYAFRTCGSDPDGLLDFGEWRREYDPQQWKLLLVWLAGSRWRYARVS